MNLLVYSNKTNVHKTKFKYKNSDKIAIILNKWLITFYDNGHAN